VTTRDRLLDAALRLFARHGYAGTSIAQIEEEAGLSGGSGGLYKHFRSKRDLLAAGIQTRIGAADDIPQLLARLEAGGDRRAAIRGVAAAGLQRLQSERYLNRILLRDLGAFPDLLAQFRDEELRRLHALLAGAFARLLPDADAEAVAAVAIAAVSHHWTLCDVFGEDPLGIGTERFLDALTDLVAGSITARPAETGEAT
jgi:AcrR family transcriptional regulator